VIGRALSLVILSVFISFVILGINSHGIDIVVSHGAKGASCRLID
jgi:hypothetical protein